MNEINLSTDMVLRELFDKHPNTVEVFINYKLGCVGCMMSSFTTLEEAMQIYQLNQEVFLEELHNVLNRDNH